jgi:hypothetical protein
MMNTFQPIEPPKQSLWYWITGTVVLLSGYAALMAGVAIVLR